MGTRLLPQYPNHSEGADRVGGQLRGGKECPFSGVTKSGRVWRVPESGARSVGCRYTGAWTQGCREGYRGPGTRVHGRRGAGRVTGLQIHGCMDTVVHRGRH